MKRRIILGFLILVGLALAIFFSLSRSEKSVAQNNQPPARGSSKGIRPVAVTADVEMQETRLLADGNVLERKTEGKYFRDSQGRVRREQAGLITITDPTTAQNFVLNPKSNLATRLVRPSAPPEGPANCRATTVQRDGESAARYRKVFAGDTHDRRRGGYRQGICIDNSGQLPAR